MTKPEIVGIVPIRDGSKGLPNKNEKLIAGKPLYQHAIEQALRTCDRVILSTDIKRITQSDLPHNCLLSRRPSHLAEDQTPMKAVINDLIKRHSLSHAHLCLLQATSPLRRDEDIAAALASFARNQFDLVMSVSAKNPSILKYGLLDGQRFEPLRKAAYSFQNRQDLPKVIGPNGAIYVFAAADFIQNEDFPQTHIGVIEMPSERSFDIDNLEDFERAEALLRAQG